MTLEMVKPAKIRAMIGPFLFSGMMSLAMLIDKATKTPLTTAVMMREKISNSYDPDNALRMLPAVKMEIKVSISGYLGKRLTKAVKKGVPMA